MISEERLREEFKSVFEELKKQEEKNKENLYQLYCKLADDISVDNLNRLGVTSLCTIHSFKATKETLKNVYELIFEEEYVEEETDTDAE